MWTAFLHSTAKVLLHAYRLYIVSWATRTDSHNIAENVIGIHDQDLHRIVDISLPNKIKKLNYERIGGKRVKRHTSILVYSSLPQAVRQA